MDRYPKRLIEVDLPIARISAHSRREKSIRHGHISTLHIWWARRPLAACRAVICASLWPDPGDELCPQAFREAVVERISAFAKRVFPDRITAEGKLLSSEKHCSPESRARWEAIAAGTLTLEANEPADLPTLRLCLLDFIADFANWDNSTVPAFLETSRALTQSAHEALGGVPGTRPLVVDPFAGGGSIPLEALRVGADAFASDLNPVAVILNKVVLEYIPKYGQRLAAEIRQWGQWVKIQAEKEVAEFYPKDPNGATPIAYLWARTILSEAPGQRDLPIEIPLIRSMWLCKKPKRRRALRWIRDDLGRVATVKEELQYANDQVIHVERPCLEIFEPKNASEVGGETVKLGSATCPVTGHTTPVESVRSQLRARAGGSRDSRILCVITSEGRGSGREYRPPNEADLAAMADAIESLHQLERSISGELSLIPNEETPLDGSGTLGGGYRTRKYGIENFGQMFNPRQALALARLAEFVGRVADAGATGDADFLVALKTCLALAVGRIVDQSTTFVAWANTIEAVTHTFGRQALSMAWDHVEPNPFGGAGGDFGGAVEWVAKVCAREADSGHKSGSAELASAMRFPLPDDSANAFVTDPPYYDSVPYADLADFFYVWLRRILGADYPSLMTSLLTPKDAECVVDLQKNKDRKDFEGNMREALAEGRRVLDPKGVGLVVFAHKSTSGWEAMLQAIIDSGWTLTGSWPIDTERPVRLRALNSAALASSVHLVCRPRETESGTLRKDVGEWRDVLSELPRRIHEWMPRLADEGVVGADAIFACLGPALEIFSRYSRVEKASGEQATLREYLEHVWAAVSTEALSMIFQDADAASLEPDGRLTAMWLWTLSAGSTNGEGESDGDVSEDEKATASTGYTLEFDAARKIAQGLGIHLDDSDSIVEVKGDKARLLPASERTRHLFGKDGDAPATGGRRKKKPKQPTFFDELDEAEAAAEGWGDVKGPSLGETVLDRVHQAMILFAAGRSEAMKRFLVEDGAGTDARFWKLAQSLSALYPSGTDEKRWVDGVLARKKGFGF